MTVEAYVTAHGAAAHAVGAGTIAATPSTPAGAIQELAAWTAPCRITAVALCPFTSAASLLAVAGDETLFIYHVPALTGFPTARRLPTLPRAEYEPVLLHRIAVGAPIHQIAWSPRSSRLEETKAALAIATQPGDIYLVEDAQLLPLDTSRAIGWVNALSFNQSTLEDRSAGTLLAAAGDAHAARLYDLTVMAATTATTALITPQGSSASLHLNTDAPAGATAASSSPTVHFAMPVAPLPEPVAIKLSSRGVAAEWHAAKPSLLMLADASGAIQFIDVQQQSVQLAVYQPPAPGLVAPVGAGRTGLTAAAWHPRHAARFAAAVGPTVYTYRSHRAALAGPETALPTGLGGEGGAASAAAPLADAARNATAVQWMPCGEGTYSVLAAGGGGGTAASAGAGASLVLWTPEARLSRAVPPRRGKGGAWWHASWHAAAPVLLAADRHGLVFYLV
ncbi:hypothetical protein CXG81DRAFT_24063 [Caulochytrium protostelioides]|uniref:WD40 repeat-like protein n=1 Tax=Caulochytrium protostelioides TaxID=1555241 RepID=A0A4V1IV96_9FUNG|nr:hypothetical protein CXG81DRAFT_24063 [Caulochytrium protostelioides]|eukprot:RKP03289.1 hypothetical protein CXG81DRAFT_24063 [Caulochytrium protostelioides]